MGTRHLICVFQNGEYKVAQYGQWDGYPGGQGATVLEFLHTRSLKMLARKLSYVSWATEDELKAQWDECGADGSGWVGMNVSKKHDALYPENSRDTGAGILYIIQNSTKELKLRNSISFAADSLFCEWAYVIDLDKNTFEVYEGFNQRPLGKKQRFASLSPLVGPSGKVEYYPIRLKKSYKLDDLPTEGQFLDDLKEKE